MALHESKFQGRSTNATGSPISHFSRSFVLYFPRIFTVLFSPSSFAYGATYSQRVLSRNEFFSSAPGTRAPTQQRSYLGSATISRRALSRNASRRLYTNAGENLHVPTDSKPRSRQRACKIYNLTRNLLHTRTLLVDSTVTDSSTMNAHERSRAYARQRTYSVCQFNFRPKLSNVLREYLRSSGSV